MSILTEDGEGVSVGATDGSGVVSGSLETPENVMSVTVLGTKGSNKNPSETLPEPIPKKSDSEWKNTLAKSIVKFNESIDLFIIPNSSDDDFYSFISYLKESKLVYYDINMNGTTIIGRIIKGIVLNENNVLDNANLVEQLVKTNLIPVFNHVYGIKKENIKLVYEDVEMGEPLLNYTIYVEEVINSNKMLELLSEFQVRLSGLYINPFVGISDMGGYIDFSLRR